MLKVMPPVYGWITPQFMLINIHGGRACAARMLPEGRSRR